MLKTLWTAEYDEYWSEVFEKEFDLTKAGMNFSDHGFALELLLKGDALLELVQDKEVFIVGYDKLTRDILKKCPELKMVMSVRDGPEENVDIECCTELGIPVLSAAGRCMHAVAELNMAIMLNLATRMITFSNRLRKDGWHRNFNDLFERTEIYGKTLSIIGLGRNGTELSKLANGAGMNVIAYDPYASKERAEELHVELVSLKEAMERGDYVTLLARVTPETEGMIGAEQISWMKSTAYLINTGRPKLVNENDVIDALEAGTIQGAAIDVFPKEPLPDDSRVYTVPPEKLLITPHMAGNSRERVPHQYEYLMDSYEKFKKGEKSGLRIYNPQVFDSPAFAQRGGRIFACEK